MANTVEIIIRGQDMATGVMQGVGREASTMGQRLQAAGRSMMTTGTGLTLGVTTPILAIGAGALKTAGDFEAATNILAIQARSSGTAMEDLSAAALQVGSDVDLVGIDAMQAADAMTNFYKAGLTTGDIFADMDGYLAGTTPLVGALRSAIDLAAASDLDLNAASELVAVSMKTFGLNAEDAAMIANDFVGAADASTAEVSDLADALVNVGPTMAQFGYGLEDTNTALALLSTRGIKGSEAGTALKSMMTNLMRPTAQVQEALSGLNVELYDQAGVLKPLPMIMRDLAAGMAGMTEEQKNQTIQTLAGTYGMKAMATLLEEGTAGWEAMDQAIQGAASAQEVGAARTQGFQASWEQLQGAIQTLMITALTPLMQNVLTPLIQRVQEFVGRVSELDPRLLNLGLVIAGVLAAAGPLLIVVGAISMVLGALLSPIGLIAAGIAALGVAWATNFLGIQDLVTAFIAVVGPIFQQVVDWFQVAIPAALAYLGELWATYWPPFQAILETVWNAIYSVISAVVGAVVPFIVSQFGVVFAWVQTNWPLIRQTIETVLNAIWSVVQFVLNAVSTFWTAHGETITALVNTYWEAIKTVISTALDVILGVIRTIMLVITGDWDGAWAEIQRIGETVWAAIQKVIGLAIEAVRLVLGGVLQRIQGMWFNAWNWMQAKIGEIWNNIKQIVSNAFNGPGAILATLTTAFATMVTRALQFGKDLMASIKEGMGNIKLPIPTFGITWSAGPLGVQIPGISIGVDWRALRDMVAWLAEGGIVTSPTLAMIGEAGPEAVIPLSGRGAGAGGDGGIIALLRRANELNEQIRDILLASTGADSSAATRSDLLMKLSTVNL